MWSDFEKLRRSWAASPRGRGGTTALAGFSFQLGSTLLEMVRADKWGGEPSVFVEALSDIVSADQGYLLVTQAKLTLASQPLRDALGELWEIHLLAATETPALAPRLKYRVLASRAALKDAQAALLRWQPTGGAAPERLDDFLSQVTVCVSPEPRQQLATHLVNAFGVDDPFARVDRWLGSLISDPNPDGFDQSCRDIFVELAALEAGARQREHLFHIWSGLDRSPAVPQFEADPSRATLIGQTPDRIHLAEGRFARRWFYDEQLAEAEKWLAGGDRTNDGRLRTFWLAGRSGTGKSVALLHLLADLHKADEGRVIIWLHQQADRMAEAVRWARPFFAEGKEVILAADDPYTPERYQRGMAAIDQAQREFDSILVAYPEAKRPSLLFCGPTEQGQAFEDDLADRVVVRWFTLHSESRRDIEELKAWYTQRTGRTDLPIDESDEVLIVQMFFEWATGEPIKAFAQRFRKRLEGMSRSRSSRTIFDVVAEILALNRLYALFPTQVVDYELEGDPDLGGSFDRLKDEELHFTFDGERSGIRLTHPHLANAIYLAWFGRREDKRHRKRHLGTGIVGALTHGTSPQQRFAPLWAISRLIAASGRPGDASLRLELIKPELRELLIELYGQNFARSLDPLVELPVWTSLNELLDLSLEPAPLELLGPAVRNAPSDARGLRLSCHMLLHRSDYPPGIGIVAEVLNTHRHWIEWAPVAADHVSTVGISGIEEALADFVSAEWMRSATHSLVRTLLRHAAQPAGRAILLAWLRSAPPGERIWAGVFTEFLDRAGLCEESLALGLHLLGQLPDDSSWSHVWERLYEMAPAERAGLQASARHWLATARPDISGWDRVWEALWGACGSNDDELRRIGEKWLDDASPEHGSWQFIWNRLWDSAGRNNDELRTRGRRWLDEASAEHGSWVFMWEVLWETRGASEPDLRARGRRWLDEAPSTHPSWKYMWDELWEASDKKDDDLRSRARSWLDEVPPEDTSWPFMWHELWHESGYDDEDLRALGRRWLDAVPAEHSFWSSVWKDLLRAVAVDDPELPQRGRRWLDEVLPQNGSWAVVWNRLWEAAGKSDEDLKARAWQWLDEAPKEHIAWTSVWEKLLDSADRDDDELRARGLRWLEDGNAAHASWAFVWERLWADSDKADEALRACGLIWLEEAPIEHPSWHYVWEELWAASGGNDPDLLQIAHRWIEEAPAEHGSWTYVWESLWQASGKADDELWARGRQWLDAAPPAHASWKYMWDNLRATPGSDLEDLRARARSWLEEAPPGHGAWKYMWEELWEASGRSDRQLLVHGRRWLDEAPADHPSWKYMWRHLWEAAGMADEDLRKRGRQWLDEARPEHGSWKYMWTDLWEAGGGADDDLIARAHRWLDEAPPDHPSWKHLWSELWQASGQSDDELLERARQWLDLVPRHAAWKYMWDEVRAASNGNDQDLLERGRRWLDEAPEHGGWKYMWDDLQRASGGQDDDLVGRAREWLANVSVLHGSWSHMWEALWEASGQSDETLWTEAYEWLGSAPSARSWPHIWRCLWRAPQATEQRRAELQAIGMDWMEGDPPLSTGWPMLWQILWNESELATDWLKAIAARLLALAPPKDPERLNRKLLAPRKAVAGGGDERQAGMSLGGSPPSP